MVSTSSVSERWSERMISMRRPRPVAQVWRPRSPLRVESVRRKEEARRRDWRSTFWSMDDPEEEDTDGGCEDEEGAV